MMVDEITYRHTDEVKKKIHKLLHENSVHVAVAGFQSFLLFHFLIAQQIKTEPTEKMNLYHYYH